MTQMFDNGYARDPVAVLFYQFLVDASVAPQNIFQSAEGRLRIQISIYLYAITRRQDCEFFSWFVSELAYRIMETAERLFYRSGGKGKSLAQSH